MVHFTAVILGHPLQALKFCYSFFAQCFIDITERVLLPHYPTYQSLRTRLARAYLGAAAIHLPDIVHRLPVSNCPASRARPVEGANWKGYIIPGSCTLLDNDDEYKYIIILYAHGGGYVRGEARQYLNYMERWINAAAGKGIKLIFLSVEYPLSTEAAHPAQRTSFLDGYQYLLDEGVPANKIIFMGDSAGGRLMTNN
ncbi:hypothetical protein PCG10_002606 [Penicillium crustosum]|uniref:Alpha/beta hydrolase fold-3 domain-containing protein n=1 Tax=Penicillium crustosum TaxID=36656 RepID=A0A9P5GS66_PENCR|nr:hypothetical protein PCG10_002606 [Penicillium crustosum]